jgi:hypothetical protein
MPGQPLSTFPKVDEATFGPGSVFQRPSLAPHVMRVVEAWAAIEATTLLIVNDCIPSSKIVATAMLQAVDSQSGQRAAVLAAVKAVVPPADWRLFEAGMLSTAASRQVRHQFVHNQWGIAPMLPDALLLLDVRHRVREHANRIVRVEEKLRKGVSVHVAAEEFNPEGTSVWRESDLKVAVKDAERADRITSELWQFVSNQQQGRANTSVRRRLKADPLIKQRLAKAVS